MPAPSSVRKAPPRKPAGAAQPAVAGNFALKLQPTLQAPADDDWSEF